MYVSNLILKFSRSMVIYYNWLFCFFESHQLSMCLFDKLPNLGLLRTCNFVPQFGNLVLTSNNRSNDMFMPQYLPKA
jgi:hypothetical protein